MTALGKRDFRVGTSVVPVKGQVLTVSAKYWGNPIGSRTLTIYENSAMPGHDCTIGMNGTMIQHAYSNTSDGWFNLSGAVNVVIRAGIGDFAMRITNGSSEGMNEDSGGNITRFLNDVRSGWSNMTLVWGSDENKSLELHTAGNSTKTNRTGVLTDTLHLETDQKSQDHNATFLGQLLEGNIGFLPIAGRIEALGIEDKANGNGVVFSCLKLRSNITGDTTADIGTGPVHLKVFNETTSWSVRDDRYVNSTIFMEYVGNAYKVNDTSGEWTLIPEFSGTGSMFPDENNDGKYNPDLAPLSLDMAFEFHGPIPRELVVGDRISGTNVHGTHVVVEVTGDGFKTVDGVNYTVVHVKSTYTSQSGNATGASDNWVVSAGNLTGLPIESTEDKTWIGSDGKTTVGATSFKVATVRED
jgi:hypothetical protein